MPAMITLNKTKTKKMTSQYIRKGMSLQSIANEWGFSIATVRRLLTDAGVTIRPRGRQKQTV